MAHFSKALLFFIICSFLIISDRRELCDAAPARRVGIDFSRGRLQGTNIEVVEASDGVPQIAREDNKSYLKIDAEKTKLGQNKNAYLYFNVNDKLIGDKPADYIVSVDYLDNSWGTISLEYNHAGNPYAPAAGGGNLMLATGKVRNAVFLLSDAKLGGRQNAGADFRLLTGAETLVARVRLFSGSQAAFLAECKKVETLPSIGKGFEVCFGGLDGGKPEDLAWVSNALTTKFPIFRQLGVTSKETYVRWNLIERKKGKYDFSFYDEQVKIHQQWGIKWVPFIIIGPAYSLPDWFYNSKERVDYVCLEHGQKSDVQSLWNPNLPKYIDAFLRKFARHYKNCGVIENILLGITGNYGESIYVATPNDDWTTDTHGKYHTHPGYWCGDEYAKASYRKWLKEKYRGIADLNNAWGTEFKTYDEIEPSTQAKGAQWLDFVEWYRQSMTDWAEFWVKTARKYFPKTDIYIVTGGHMPPEHGLDISAQAKMCAKYDAGIRITNEATRYALNYQLTRLTASSCRFYKTYFGFEPAGNVAPTGVVGRIYNATASGAKHVHFYENLVCNNPQAISYWMKYAETLQQRDPKIECALLYPFTWTTLKRKGFPGGISRLRDTVDVAWIDERMVVDGALADFRVLIINEGDVFPKEVLENIDKWVQDGGVLIANNANIKDVSGDDSFAKNVLRIDKPFDAAKSVAYHSHEKGLVVRLASPGALASVLYGGDKIEGFAPLATMEVDVEKCASDRVYLTHFEKSALVLNFNNRAVKKIFLTRGEEKEFELPPFSITEIKR